MTAAEISTEPAPTPLEVAIQERAALQALAAELLALDARAKVLRAEVLEGMAARGIDRIDVDGKGLVTFVGATTSTVVDGKKLEKRFGALVELLAKEGRNVEADLFRVPLKPSNRSACVRLKHNKGVGLDLQEDEEDLG